VDDCDAGENDQTDTVTVPAGTYTLRSRFAAAKKQICFPAGLR
jgi:hypothetical protein